MARNYLQELFEKAKQAAQQKAQEVTSGVKNFVQAIPQNLQKQSERVIPGGIAGGVARVKASKPSDYFVFSPQALRSGQQSANALGSMTQSWGQRQKETPGIGDDAKRTVANFATNWFKGMSSATGNAAAGSQNIATGFQQRKPLQAVKGGAQFLYGSGTSYLNTIPAYHAINLAGSLDKPIDRNDIIRRASVGIQEGMTGAEDLGSNVPRQMQKFFGMQFDPAEAGGKMLGFVKHPVNNQLFKMTEGIKLPLLAEKIAGNPGLQRTAAKVANFLATNGVRGTVEDVVMNLQDLPETATPEEQMKFLAERGLMGAASEIAGRAFFKGTDAVIGNTGKLIKGKLDEVDVRPVVEFLQDINLLRKEAGSETPGVTRRGPRTAAEIIRDAQGRFSTEPAAPARKPVVDWTENPDRPGQWLRTEDGVIPQKPVQPESNMRFIQDKNQPSRWVRDGRQLQTMNAGVGGLAGMEIERDENGKPTGKVKFNTQNALGGMFAVGALQSKAGKQIISEAVDNLGKNADEVVDNPQTADEFISNARAGIKNLPETPKMTWKEGWDKFYTDWVDRFHPIVQAATAAEKKVEGMNAKLRPEANPKYAIRRFLGVGGIAEQKFRDSVEPVLKQLDEQGVDKIDMDAYLKARRDINLGERGIYGSDPVKAQATVQAFEQKYGPEKLQSIATQLYDYQNKLFDEVTEAGFIKPDVAARIKATNADYVPFERVMDDTQLDEFLGIPTKKVVQGTSPIDKRIKGSDRDIYSPIESIIANTYKYTAAVEKNKVAQTIAKLQDVMPELNFTVAKESGADTIPVWVDGVKQHIKVGKDIAEAAKGLNEEQMNNVLKIMQLPAQILRSGATGQNPEFMVPNVIRDQFEAALYSNYGYRPFVDYFRGMAHIINKERTGSDEIVDAWMKSGASQELSSMTGRQSIQEFFNKNTGKKGLFGWLGDALDFMGKYSEQPTRVGLFERAKNATGNTNIAMMESRDATLDFSRMGSKMKVANSIIPFLNVGVQGFDKLVRQAKDKPAQTAIKVAIYGLLPQMASTMYNLVNHPQEYAEIPQFEKDNNFVFVDGRNPDGTVNYYTVPKAQSMTNFVNPMENFLSYMAGTNKQSFGEFATAFLSGALPVIGEGASPQEVGVRTVGQLTPQIVKPATENLLNKSFFRFNAKDQAAKEIVPYYLKDKAPGDQSYDFTPDAYKVIGKVLNVSPLQVQNLAEGYFAGYTKVPVQIINLLAKTSRGEEITPNEVTLMRRFAKQTYPTSQSQQKKKQQAAETPLIPQANASTGFPQQTPVINKVGDKSTTPPQVEDTRNWFQKLFNIQLEAEAAAPAIKIPTDDAGMEVMYKEAKSTLRGYDEQKTKYQYGRYDSSTNIEEKLAGLDEDKAFAEGVIAEIEKQHPDKVADFEMKSYKSGAGANVEERAQWAYETIKKLGETGETDKLTTLIDKMWDEKVLTGGKDGVAQKILDEFGLNVFTYGKDAKKSKDPNAKGTGKSKAQKKLETERKKLMDQFFTAAAKEPKVGGTFKAPKSEVNWGNMKFEAPVSAEDAKLTTTVPKLETPSVEQIYKPKQGQVALAQARELVASLRTGGAKDNHLTLRYAGGRSR